MRLLCLLLIPLGCGGLRTVSSTLRKPLLPPLARQCSEKTQPTSSRQLDYLLLNSVALLFGTQHVIMKSSILDYDSASVFNFWRFLLSSLVFGSNLKGIFQDRSRKSATLQAGLELGCWTFLGFAFQSIGLETTTASRSAFLLYLNVKIVPFFAYFLFKKEISVATWISASFALLGTYLLANDGGSPSVGDFWSMVAAAASAMYILRLEKFSRENNAGELNSVAFSTGNRTILSNIQNLFSTVAILSFLWMLWDHRSSGFSIEQVCFLPVFSIVVLLGHQVGHSFLENPFPVIYLGVIATGLCNYLQTLGQRTVPAEKAAIIYSLDPIYSAVFAKLILDEQLGAQGYLGGLAIVVGVLISAADKTEKSSTVSELS